MKAKAPNNHSGKSPKHLTGSEVDRVLAEAKKGRHGVRDHAMLLVAYSHGLRVSELIELRLDDIKFADHLLFIRRKKRGIAGQHPLGGREAKALKRYLATRRESRQPTLFLTERGDGFTRQGVGYLCAAIGKRAGISFHPHMLRHACGFALAEQEHDIRKIGGFLGHRQLKNTQVYTEGSPVRFKGIDLSRR